MPTPSATRKKGISPDLKRGIQNSLQNFKLKHGPRGFDPTHPPSEKVGLAAFKLLEEKRGGNKTRRHRRRH